MAWSGLGQPPPHTYTPTTHLTFPVMCVQSRCLWPALAPPAGLLTLLFIVLATTNARLILENLLKYGLRFNPITFVRYALTPSGNFALLLCWPFLALCVLAAYGIEALGVWCLRMEHKASVGGAHGGWGWGAY